MIRATLAERPVVRSSQPEVGSLGATCDTDTADHFSIIDTGGGVAPKSVDITGGQAGQFILIELDRTGADGIQEWVLSDLLFELTSGVVHVFAFARGTSSWHMIYHSAEVPT